VNGRTLATFPIAYIAAVFPRVSETFVYRELRGLRQRGWDVIAVSLNPAETVGELEESDAAIAMVVYGRETRSTLIAAAWETGGASDSIGGDPGYGDRRCDWAGGATFRYAGD